MRVVVNMAKSIVFAVAWLVLLPPTWAATTPVEINVKPKTLSEHFTPSDGTTEENYNPVTTQRPYPTGGQSTPPRKAKSKKEWIGVDWSGQVECHVVGPPPAVDDESAFTSPTKTIPLFQIESRNDKTTKHIKSTSSSLWPQHPPSLFAGLEYDFAKAWYGATRLFLAMRCQWKKDPRSEWSTDPTIQRHSGSLLQRRLRPSLMEFRAEQGLEGRNQQHQQQFYDSYSPNNPNYAAQLALHWNQGVLYQREDDPFSELTPSCTSLITRYNAQNNKVSISFMAPIHRRLEILYKLIVLPRQMEPYPFFSQEQPFDPMSSSTTAEPSPTKGYFSSRVKPTDFEQEDWWVPTMSFHGATGMFTAKQQIGVAARPPSSLTSMRRNTLSRSWQVSLRVRRKFAGWTPWSVLVPRDDDESNNDEDGAATWFEIQCISPSRNGDSMTTLKAESTLENVIDSCRFRLQHEQAVAGSLLP